MSDTPRTDSNCGWPVGQHGRIKSSDLIVAADGPFVHSTVARELERENAALRQELDWWHKSTTWLEELGWRNGQEKQKEAQS